MKILTILAAAVLTLAGIVTQSHASEMTKDFEVGTPNIKSMSILEFGPDGILFIGDSKGGNVFAIETGDVLPPTADLQRFAVQDLEGKIAAMLGTGAEDLMIHDMAVNPISANTYIAVSRARSTWTSGWVLPNELADATILMRVTAEKTIEEFPLTHVKFARASLPNPVDLNVEHRWKKGVTTRADAITAIAYDDGTLYLSGLSNEEFASTMWSMGFPFKGDATWATLEIFHGAHGEFETHAPIRAFLPYQLDGQSYILASYLCTPLVTFPTKDLSNGQHIMGKTIGELGSGNYPIDMVSAEWEGRQFIVMSNSMLPLMTFNVAEITKYNAMQGITTEPDTYLAGASYTPRAGNGVQHMDNFGDRGILCLQRMPSGKLDMVALSVERLAF
ncbi:MAG: hypothetical protein O7D32_02195 [bacterium]|nr:hypothetical protein [bacterium]